MNNAKRQLWFRYYLPSYLYAELIFAFSSYSLAFPPALPTFGDKWIHLLEYAIFGFLLARSYSHADTRILKKYFIIFAFLTGITWGLMDEYYQSFVPSRNSEVFDFACDIFGVLAGAGLYRFTRGFNKVAE